MLVPLANEPTLADVKDWMRLDPADTLDDVALREGLASAISYQRSHFRFPTDGAGVAYYPDDLRMAVFLRTARYLARRSSPEGLVGFGEFGPAQIATVDRDIREVEAPYMKPSVA